MKKSRTPPNEKVAIQLLEKDRNMYDVAFTNCCTVKSSENIRHPDNFLLQKLVNPLHGETAVHCGSRWDVIRIGHQPEPAAFVL